mgnify:CR=1 FL=1
MTVSDQDYFQAFEVLTATIADMRKRIIALEAMNDTINLEDRIDTIVDSLKDNTKIGNWIIDLIETKIDEIDWESQISEHLQDETVLGALAGHSMTVTFD